MSKELPRRAYSRFACDLPVQIYSPVSQTKLADARLFDVGMGGGNIYCDLVMQRAVPYEFRFQWGKERLAVLGRVVWSAAAARKEPRFARYGVVFSLTRAQEDLLAALVDRVRRFQPSEEGEDRLKGYWSR